MNIDLDNDCKEDLLERKEDIDYLYQFIINKHNNNPLESLVLNINGQWGSGKTCLLQSLHNRFNNDSSKVMYFDAWKHDFEQDPFRSFVSAFTSRFRSSKIESIQKSALNVSIGCGKIIGKSLVKKYTGDLVENIRSELFPTDDSSKNSDTLVDADSISEEAIKYIDSFGIEHENNLLIIKNIKSNLEAISAKNKGDAKTPLIIIIDELDRCRPNFSIELLEAIKHVFTARGVFFLLGTDTKQLENSLHVVYGDKFDTTKYLKRFFDLEYTLEQPDILKVIYYQFSTINKSSVSLFFNPLHDELIPAQFTGVEEIFSLYAKMFNLQLRDIEQIIKHLKIVSNGFGDNIIHIIWLLFLIVLKHQEPEVYHNYKNFKIGLDEIISDVLKRKKEYNLNAYTSGLKAVDNSANLSISMLIGYYDKSRRNALTITRNENIPSLNRIREKAIKENGFNHIGEAQSQNATIRLNSITKYFKQIDNAGKFISKVEKK